MVVVVVVTVVVVPPFPGSLVLVALGFLSALFLSIIEKVLNINR